MFDWNTSSDIEKVNYLGLKLQQQQHTLSMTEAYYLGNQPTSFVAPEIAEQLHDRLATLNVNYCRLLVDNLVQRISVSGFRLNGSDNVNATTWAAWSRCGMNTDSDHLLRDVFALGRGYLLVWSDPRGRPLVTVESPYQMIVQRDPVTREVVGALKQHSTYDEARHGMHSWAVLYLPERIVSYESQSTAAVNSIPNVAWRPTGTTPNPLHAVPVVEFANRSSILDFYGTSEYEPIMGLQDALNKTLLDAMVASEYGALQRRWATGLQVQYDENGEPINPFTQAWDEIFSSEKTDTKFGAFPAASLENFNVQANLLTRNIAAISGLPQHLTGAGVANPVSSEAIRAAELTLTVKAKQKCDSLAPAFGQAAALLTAIVTGRPVANIWATPVYADLTTDSQSVQTDAFVKLAQAGVPLNVAAEMALGLSEQDALRLLPKEPKNDGNNGNGDRAAA